MGTFHIGGLTIQLGGFLAASLESPQTTYSVGTNGTGVDLGTVNFNNPGTAQLDPGQAYSTDMAPDVIVKSTADPGYGHYELYGLARFMQDRVSVVGNGHGNTRLGGGVGGGFILPIIGNNLTFEGRGLAGYGVGRYGSGQLPDATISQSGAPSPLPEVQALVGIVGHPQSDIDLYSYVGTERIGRKFFNAGGKAYGYGNPAYSNAGCDVELHRNLHRQHVGSNPGRLLDDRIGHPVFLHAARHRQGPYSRGRRQQLDRRGHGVFQPALLAVPVSRGAEHRVLGCQSHEQDAIAPYHGRNQLRLKGQSLPSAYGRLSIRRHRLVSLNPPA